MQCVSDNFNEKQNTLFASVGIFSFMILSITCIHDVKRFRYDMNE